MSDITPEEKAIATAARRLEKALGDTYVYSYHPQPARVPQRQHCITIRRAINGEWICSGYGCTAPAAVRDALKEFRASLAF